MTSGDRADLHQQPAEPVEPTGPPPSASAQPSIAERVDAALTHLRHGRDIERTVFFSDAVFAIAMTLLVLELRVPDTAATGEDARAFAEAFAERVPAFLAFALSFFLVGSTWLTHHRRFRAIVAYDTRLQVLNLALLFCVAFMPVPSGMLFQPSGNSAIPPILYAATIVAMYAAHNAVWRYAHRTGLLDPDMGEPFYRLTLTSTRGVSAVFLASMPLALINPLYAELAWVVIGPVSILDGRWQRRRFVRAETARLQALQAAEA